MNLSSKNILCIHIMMVNKKTFANTVLFIYLVDRNVFIVSRKCNIENFFGLGDDTFVFILLLGKDIN